MSTSEMRGSEAPPPLFLHSDNNTGHGPTNSTSRNEGRNRNHRDGDRSQGWGRRGSNNSSSRGRQAQFDDNRRQYTGRNSNNGQMEDDWRSDTGGTNQQPQQRRPPRGRGHNQQSHRGHWNGRNGDGGNKSYRQEEETANSNGPPNFQGPSAPTPLMNIDANRSSASGANGPNGPNGGAVLLAAISGPNPFSVTSSSLNPDAPSFHPTGTSYDDANDRSDRFASSRSSNAQQRRAKDDSGRRTNARGHGSKRETHPRAPNRIFDNRRMAFGDEESYYEESGEEASNSTRGGGGGAPVAPVEEVKVVFKVKKKAELKNQRENLSDQLERNAYDCMICVERVKRFNPVWSCGKCFNVFHLTCLRKWANSSADEVGWRCPGCQSYSEVIPSVYFCFCGAVKNPPGNLADIPHCCGQTCGKGNVGGEGCVHSCTIPCHPGPCPPCEALVQRLCSCGKTSAQVKCSSKSVVTCGNSCDKPLACSAHKCSRPCHSGPCDACAVLLKLRCFCGCEEKEELCTRETVGVVGYSCSRRCAKALNCGNHKCAEECHAGRCRPCGSSPSVVLSCPCGQTPIAEATSKAGLPARTSCLDKIPTCGKVCRRILQCGGGDGEETAEVHRCAVACHVAPECPPCPLKSQKKCRCGNKTFHIPCATFNPREDVLCEKKCAKKRNCGKHKCNLKCCIDPDHICPIVCDRPLRCGNHNCALLCHNGHCPPCRNVSFEELTCECGDKVIYPPVPCGTKPPPCSSPCPRVHECAHPVLHHCHSDVTCPPCTVLTEKWCNGKHELRKNVMCHIKQLSCGMPCRKRLPCGRHTCVKTCHVGICLSPREVCQLPCETLKSCGHKCGGPCHDPPCPESKCKITTEVTCECGRKKETMICWRREKEYDRQVTYLMNLELKRLREAALNSEATSFDDINPAAILADVKDNTPKTNVLECDKECARVERNRKLVEALQLKDPDVTSSFGTPNYSEFLVSFTKKNPQFVEMVHQRLTSVVVRSKTSKKKNETYAFESMNRDKRHVVHEYSDHFGCISESFDVEPNRNVIVTASKEKSYVPQVSLIDSVFRPNITTERKNLFDEVELVQNSKSTIFRPANGKIGNLTSGSQSGMVALAPMPAWGTSSSGGATSAGASGGPLPVGCDFPALK